MKPRLILILLTILLASFLGLPSVALAQAKKPNILVIFGDTIRRFSAENFCDASSATNTWMQFFPTTATGRFRTTSK